MWLRSVAYNPTVDFLLVTDISYDKPYPPNVKVIDMTFGCLKARIQANFDFTISLDIPYKLCDYKPTWGLVFQNELASYDYWGYCDIDQVFGAIRDFVTDRVLDRYPRVGYLGHFSLFRNCTELNLLFMQSGALFDYRSVYSSSCPHAFDEATGLLQITLRHNIHVYTSPCYADIRVSRRRFCLQSPLTNRPFQVFYWDAGHVYRAYLDDNDEVSVDEYLYLHFQKKSPTSVPQNWPTQSSFYCFGDRFLEKGRPGVPTMNEIRAYSNYRGPVAEFLELAGHRAAKVVNYVRLRGEPKRIWRAQLLARRTLLLPTLPLDDACGTRALDAKDNA